MSRHGGGKVQLAVGVLMFVLQGAHVLAMGLLLCKYVLDFDGLFGALHGVQLFFCGHFRLDLDRLLTAETALTAAAAQDAGDDHNCDKNDTQGDQEDLRCLD